MRISIAVLLMAASCNAAAAAGAQSVPGTLYAALVDAAERDGLKVIWDAGPSAVLAVRTEDLPEFVANRSGKPLSGYGMLNWALGWHEAWVSRNPVEGPLFACVHPNAIRVVRDGADCTRATGKP